MQERFIEYAASIIKLTEVWLKIILRVEIILPSKLSSILTETDELIAILVKSIQTAKKIRSDSGRRCWITIKNRPPLSFAD